MSKTITFATKSGAAIELSLVTERTKVADHTMIDACWELVASINGTSSSYRVGLEDHATAGRILRSGSTLVAIPADKLAEIEALVAEYKAGVEARHANWLADAEAEADHARFTRLVARDGLGR